MNSRILAILILLSLLPLHISGQNPDIDILRKLNSPDKLPSDGFFRFISDSDPFIVIAVPAGITAEGYFRKNDGLLNKGLTGIAALAVTGGITTILKYSINRKRPFETYPEIEKKAGAGSPSFPSGHTSGAFAMATSLSLAFPKWYVIAPSFAWAGTVGYSRMHLGVHYPSDVLAGAIIGSGCAWLSYKVCRKLTSVIR